MIHNHPRYVVRRISRSIRPDYASLSSDTTLSHSTVAFTFLVDLVTARLGIRVAGVVLPLVGYCNISHLYGIPGQFQARGTRTGHHGVLSRVGTVGNDDSWNKVNHYPSISR
jgi:hypothetical protein